MKIPNLENLIDEAEAPELERVFNRKAIFEALRDKFSERKSTYISANSIYDYVSWICSFNTKVSKTKIFSDVVSIYRQLGHSIEDVPAGDGKEAFSSLYLSGVLESIEYTLRRIDGD